ncbi:MAG: glycosyltransferase, partial [Exilispira sp.]
MKKLLIISFYFPPTGVGGAIRIVKFTKYLPSFDIEPIILTTTEDTFGVKDYSLLNELPENLKIFRIPSFYIFNYMPKFKFLKLNQIIAFIGRNFIWPDSSIYWAKKVFIEACKIIENEKIDYILTTGGPFSVHLTGLDLKKKFPFIQWIADFRDEWTLNPFVKYGFFRRLYERKLEKRVMQKADKVITISNHIKDKYIRLYPFLMGKIKVIYNGFDEDDFKNYKKEYVKSDYLNIA